MREAVKTGKATLEQGVSWALEALDLAKALARCGFASQAGAPGAASEE